MNVYVCADHDYVQPTGVASIIVAKNYIEAQELLDAELKAVGLKTWMEHPYTLELVSLAGPSARILVNGDY